MPTVAFCCLASMGSVKAQLISLQNGQLVYGKYANRSDAANVTNRIPDFSFAGYRGGGVAIPTVAVVKTITPVVGDCRALIQAAIDEVSARTPDANGFRGAILLKAGVYPVSDQLLIQTAGVVLRGEGTEMNQTVIIGTKTDLNLDTDGARGLLEIRGTQTGLGEVAGSRVLITAPFVPTGSNSLTVAAGHTFQVGDRVGIQRTVNQAWIDAIGMATYGWTPDGYSTNIERTITAISGTQLTFDLPFYLPFYEQFGGGAVFKVNGTGRIRNVGVENIRFESVFASNTDEAHEAFSVKFLSAENCWARNLLSKYFSKGCVLLDNYTRFNTVEDCGMLDHKSVVTGGRRYSFSLEGYTYGNLIQRCYTYAGRHDFVSGARVPGPNVFLDCGGKNATAESGPHHRYSDGQLYDNIKLNGSGLGVGNNTNLGTGHGWTGASILLWNSADNYIRATSPPYAMNWAIGNIGTKQENNLGVSTPSAVGTAIWESHGTNVLPRSLYLQQLQDRLGVQAVANIISPSQDATLNDNLAAKAGTLQTQPRSIVPTAVAATAPDVTDNGGATTAQFENTSKASENYPSVFDNSTTTKYYMAGVTALCLRYQSPVSRQVVAYTLTSANDVPERDPKDWKLTGSNDALTWTTLDIRSGQTFTGRGQTKSFTVATPGSYLFYRLEITANNGATGTQLAEWQLTGATGGGRQAAEEPMGLRVKLLGNPVREAAVRVEIQGAEGGPVTLNLLDSMGRRLTSKQLTHTADVEQVDVALQPGWSNVLLLQVSTDKQQQTLKVIQDR